MVKQTRIRMVCILTAVMMIAALCTPMTVSAAGPWTAPETPMAVDDDIVKVGAHAAATSAVHYLGGNLVTERASDFSAITTAADSAAKYEAGKARLELGIFGTNINESPDPYMWNYLYNLYDNTQTGTSQSNDAVYLINAGGPTGADQTTPLADNLTLKRRPDVLYGIQGTDDTNGYTALLEEINQGLSEGDVGYYNPAQARVKMETLYADQVETMYDLSDAIIKSGKAGRYGDTDVIAQKYERYIKGTQLYIMSQIAAGKIAKKTVSIIKSQPETDGRYAAYTEETSAGTAATVRAAEYLGNTTDNIVAKLNIPNEGTDSKAYFLEPEEVVQADYIIVERDEGASREDIISDLKAAGVDEGDIPPIYAKGPDGIFAIFANSVENIFGIPSMQGFVYPEVINPIHGAMYLYENFWHVDDRGVLEDLATSNFATASLADTGVSVENDPAQYSASEIESMIAAGFDYYKKNGSLFDGTKLQPSSRLGIVADKPTATNPPAVTPAGKIDISNAAVSAIKNRAYTGRQIRPAVTINVAGVTLRNNTDYTAVYSNNVKTGKATVTVTGQNNYTGTVKATFNIVPKKQSRIKSAKSNKRRQLTVTWRRDTQATGYQVVIGTNRKITKGKKIANIKRNRTLKRTFTKLKARKVYYVKIRAYKTINGKKVYGAWSVVKKTNRVRR